jgi:hypothetical protein
MERVLIRCLVNNSHTDWEETMIWGLKALHSKNMKATLCILSWSVSVQYLEAGEEEKIVQDIIWEVRTQIMAKERFKKTQENLELC